MTLLRELEASLLFKNEQSLPVAQRSPSREQRLGCRRRPLQILLTAASPTSRHYVWRSPPASTTLARTSARLAQSRASKCSMEVASSSGNGWILWQSIRERSILWHMAFLRIARIIDVDQSSAFGCTLEKYSVGLHLIFGTCAYFDGVEHRRFPQRPRY